MRIAQIYACFLMYILLKAASLMFHFSYQNVGKYREAFRREKMTQELMVPF